MKKQNIIIMAVLVVLVFLGVYGVIQLTSDKE